MDIHYDKSVVVIPKHLSLEFFEEVVENAIGEAGPQLKKVFIKMGSSAGDNYCSIIYRVVITYTLKEDLRNEKSLSIIIKSMPAAKSIEFLEDMNVFQKEKIFYYQILPIMEIFAAGQQKFGAKWVALTNGYSFKVDFNKSSFFNCRMYYCAKKPINTLVFQDLTSLGYGLASREVGLDEQHATLVLKRLAQFHSISVAVHQKVSWKSVIKYGGGTVMWRGTYLPWLFNKDVCEWFPRLNLSTAHYHPYLEAYLAGSFVNLFANK